MSTRSSKRKRTSSSRTGTATPQAPRPRTHAFTGCGNCRDRHVKCDLGTPNCLNCSRLKLNCEGYSRKYQWIPSKFSEKGRCIPTTLPVDDAEETQTSRRVLFSVEERSAMSLQMRNECCENSSALDLDRVLKDLQDGLSELDGCARIGPFGILTVGKEPKVDTIEIINQDVDDHIVERSDLMPMSELGFSPSQLNWDCFDDPLFWNNIVPPTDTLVNPDHPASTETFESMNATSWEPSNTTNPSDFVYYPSDGADILVYEPPPPRVEIPAVTNPLDYVYYASDGADVMIYEPLSLPVDDSTGILDISSKTDNSASLVDLSRPSIPLDQPMEFYHPQLSISTMSNEANLSKVPAEARFLLDYYSERIIAVMSMSASNKPPWKTIHLPCAMSAFADLIVHGKIRSLARKALFYALLSISSYHIGFSSKDDNSAYWQERGQHHKNTSEKLLASALRDKMPKAARGKYKEILMTGLSMVTIGVFSGNMQEAHAHLSTSEDLIRTEGLPKPVKSQKISKLHHIFSFLRIIHESTSVRDSKTPSDYDPSHALSAPTDPSLASSQTSGSRLAWVEDDEPDDLEEDSLFVSIYQMPTTLLSLLSQTSSLCKQLSSSEAATLAFARRCQIVEDRIFNWIAPENLSLQNHSAMDTALDSEKLGRDIAAHLVSATYLALIVHFQRQIRNTNPRVLQHYISTAADHLLIHEQLKQSNDIKTAPFPWPSFIISCEAYDALSRQKMGLYWERCRCYNLGSLVKSEKVVHEVWRRQDEGRKDARWVDVLRDWDMQVVLT